MVLKLWVLLLALVSAASPAMLFAQDDVRSDCPTERLRGTLGFSGYHCAGCAIYTEDDFIEFEAEPRIGQVDPGGPAAGRLEPLDQLVAVDGMLITTRGAAIRLATVKPGESVRLTVRRGGNLTDVSVTADAECAARARMPGWFERYRAGRSHLGIGIRCAAGCTVRIDDDGSAVWSFREQPTITGVMPGSSADRAGVRDGDLLVSIDGLEITSSAAGVRMGNFAAGDSVSIVVRRAETYLEFDLVAR